TSQGARRPVSTSAGTSVAGGRSGPGTSNGAGPGSGSGSAGSVVGGSVVGDSVGLASVGVGIGVGSGASPPHAAVSTGPAGSTTPPTTDARTDRVKDTGPSSVADASVSPPAG